MAKTNIFKNYEMFSRRKDRSINGVSPEFSEFYPDYQEDNLSNEGCWNCRAGHKLKNCVRTCYSDGCTNCIDCHDCSGCTGLVGIHGEVDLISNFIEEKR